MSVLDRTKLQDNLQSLLEPVFEPLPEPTIPEQPKDQLLEDLRQLKKLFKSGQKWTRGAWSRGNQFCMEGGIGHVAGVDGDFMQMVNGLGTFTGNGRDRNTDQGKRVRAMLGAVEKAAGIPRHGIPHWNDSQADIDDIRNAIDKAIQTRVEKLTLEQAKKA